MNKTLVLLLSCLIIPVVSIGIAAEWEPTHGLTGMRITSLAVNGTHLYAGTQDSGMFRSTDSGTHWLAVNASLTDRNIRALEVRGAFLFAGTSNGGVFRSGDSATSWQAVNTGISALQVQALGKNDSFLFAGTSGGGVCRSDNNGTNWVEVSHGLVHINVFSLGITNKYVFAGTWGGSAFRTADNGMNWFLVTNGLYHPSENKIPVCFAVADTFIFTGTLGGGVFRGKDSARVWYSFNTGLSDTQTVKALTVIGDTIFAGTKTGVFASYARANSIDNLNTAHWVSDHGASGPRGVLSFAASGSSIWAGTDSGGVWRRQISAMAPPLAPLLVQGGNDTISTDTMAVLWHRASPYVNRYHIQVCSDSLCTSLISADSSITDTTVMVRSLIDKNTYWWRVRAHNAAGWGLFSHSGKFAVRIPSTAVHASSLKGTNLATMYTQSRFQYVLTDRCRVSLVAYDVRGRVLRKYVTSIQSPGYFDVKLDRDNLATGPLYVVFKAGDEQRLFVNTNFSTVQQ